MSFWADAFFSLYSSNSKIYAASNCVAGPFGLIISYSIAAGVVEGKLIPELKNKLKSVQNFFTTLSN
ncbi:hemolysin E, partial [Escherichia coli]|uniref:hemolysin E n=1 Tax=Escherichia coli TaxID=562 RepID=UPI003F4DB86A